LSHQPIQGIDLTQEAGREQGNQQSNEQLDIIK
jgi:hypothetical protein